MRAGIHPNKEICCSKKYIVNSIEAQKIDVENFFFKIFPKKSVGSAVKNRVGRVTLNKAIFFFGLRGNYFSIRTVNCWNSLPDSVVKADNVNIFQG